MTVSSINNSVSFKCLMKAYTLKTEKCTKWFTCAGFEVHFQNRSLQWLKLWTWTNRLGLNSPSPWSSAHWVTFSKSYVLCLTHLSQDCCKDNMKTTLCPTYTPQISKEEGWDTCMESKWILITHDRQFGQKHTPSKLITVYITEMSSVIKIQLQ